MLPLRRRLTTKSTGGAQTRVIRLEPPINAYPTGRSYTITGLEHVRHKVRVRARYNGILRPLERIGVWRAFGSYVHTYGHAHTWAHGHADTDSRRPNTYSNVHTYGYAHTYGHADTNSRRPNTYGHANEEPRTIGTNISSLESLGNQPSHC